MINHAGLENLFYLSSRAQTSAINYLSIVIQVQNTFLLASPWGIWESWDAHLSCTPIPPLPSYSDKNDFVKWARTRSKFFLGNLIAGVSIFLALEGSGRGKKGIRLTTLSTLPRAPSQITSKNHFFRGLGSTSVGQAALR